jgi:hypothetical protein
LVECAAHVLELMRLIRGAVYCAGLQCETESDVPTTDRSNVEQDIDQLLVRAQRCEADASADAVRMARLRELRGWQSARLARTYEDLRSLPRYAGAIEFFLSDLYGAGDSGARNRDLARAWRFLRRTLPPAMLQVMARALELQVLSAELDLAMIGALPPGTITAASYAVAYRAVGRPDQRRRQIDLVVSAGEELDRAVRHAWVGLALRAAHVPAHAAGFGTLQDFHERGFAAFSVMNGAQRLLECVQQRETQLMDALLLPGDDDALWMLDRPVGTGED